MGIFSFLALLGIAYLVWRIADQLPDLIFRLSEIQRDVAEIRRRLAPTDDATRSAPREEHSQVASREEHAQVASREEHAQATPNVNVRASPAEDAPR